MKYDMHKGQFRSPKRLPKKRSKCTWLQTEHKLPQATHK